MSFCLKERVQTRAALPIVIAMLGMLLLNTAHADRQIVIKDRNLGGKIQKIITAAKSYLNVPYRYGGVNRAGIDCSALVQKAFAATGIAVPRTAYSQYQSSVKLDKKALKPGDLVFFRIKRNRPVSHVGIYLGNNQMLHASQASKRVRVVDLNKQYWQQRFVAGGRLQG